MDESNSIAFVVDREPQSVAPSGACACRLSRKFFTAVACSHTLNNNHSASNINSQLNHLNHFHWFL